ncbi:MAG: hypothetical protein QM729_21180 [Solirubrobacterales bacterium]
MQPNPIKGQTNDALDRAAELAVLSRVVWLHPTHLTEGELLLNLYADGGRKDERFERAIRDLVGVGLLRIDGDSLVPTLAALHSEGLPR